VYGYRWLDAMSHEYMHYLIMKLTSNKALSGSMRGLPSTRRRTGEAGRPTFHRFIKRFSRVPWPMEG